MNSITKDPDAVLTYGFDWADGGANDGAATDPGWLQGDTIATSVWVVSGPDSALTDSGPTNSTTETSVILSGGTANSDYEVTNRVTTAAGHIDDRTIKVMVRQR